MIFLLIRHGANESLGKFLPGRLPGIHLNEEGKDQASRIAESLALKHVNAIYASPLDRTMETAAPLSARIGVEIIPDNGLMEMDSGTLTGIPFKELKKIPEWQSIRNSPAQNRFPGGESFIDASDRVWQCIQRIQKDQPDDALVAIFSHSDMIKMIVASAVQIPLSRFPGLVIYPASLTILGFFKDTFWLGGLNIPLPYNIPDLQKI